MLKKLLSLFLALCLAFCLVSCKDDKDGKGEKDSNENGSDVDFLPDGGIELPPVDVIPN